MKKILFALLFLYTVYVSFAQNIVIRHVNIIPMTQESVLQNQTVVLENGIIKSILPSKDDLKTPKNATIIDGTGKYLMPGLMDMHAHFYYEQGENHNTCEAELKMMLANGVTTARIMAGHPAYLEAKDNIKTGKWIGTDLFVVSPQLAGQWRWGTEFKNYELVETPEQGVAAVKKYKREGYSEIKLTFLVKKEVYDAVIETAKKEGIKVTGHVGPLVRLPTALAAKQQIEHMDEFIEMLLPDTSYNHGSSVSDFGIYSKAAWATLPFMDESKIPALAKMVKEAGIYVTPTNYFFLSTLCYNATDEQIKQNPSYPFIPKSLNDEKWRNRQYVAKMQLSAENMTKYERIRHKMVAELWKAGVPLMAGSDSPEFFLVTGFALHDELESFVKSGLSPIEALKTATVHTAKYLSIEKQKGSVEVGKAADLILLDKNPLDDIRHTRAIQAVFKGDKYFDKKALDNLLTATQKVLSEN